VEFLRSSILTQLVLDLALRIVPAYQRPQYQEEWPADLQDFDTYDQILRACDFVIASLAMRLETLRRVWHYSQWEASRAVLHGLRHRGYFESLTAGEFLAERRHHLHIIIVAGGFLRFTINLLHG